MVKAVAKQFLGNVVVTYNATLHRLYNDNTARRFAEHVTCRRTNGKNAMLARFAAVFGFLLSLILHFLMGDVQRNGRRLFQHKPLAPNPDTHVRGPEVDSNIIATKQL